MQSLSCGLAGYGVQAVGLRLKLCACRSTYVSLLVLCSCGLTHVHVQAVLFVRDLDRGILGRGSHGLQQYEMLRRGTDALVNGILRVRRLLKQKRTTDGDGKHPRRLSRPVRAVSIRDPQQCRKITGGHCHRGHHEVVY